jgi:hypothetical protein
LHSSNRKHVSNCEIVLVLKELIFLSNFSGYCGIAFV